MKQKYFFSHLIDITDIDIPLSELPISKKEKEHLLELSEENLQLTIVDIILSELPEEYKKEFLTHIHKNNHDKVWELLNKNISDVEKKIVDAATNVLVTLKKDIADLKNK